MVEINVGGGSPQESRQLGALGVLLILMAIGLVLNSLLGPAFGNLIRYPLSETMLNQTMGLELFSLLVLAPLVFWIGLRAWRGHEAAAPLSIGPAAFGAYMFTQYVIGPEYIHYPPQVLLHLVMFMLSGAILLLAWLQMRWLMPLAPRVGRVWAAVLAFLVIFVILRYLDPLVKMIQGGGLMGPEFAADITMYWTIFFLDLGIVVPLTMTTAVGLLQGMPWASRALYAVIGWFALVPPSVAMMAIVMLWNNDPFADVITVAILVASAVVFGWLAYQLYRPLLRRRRLA
jgi:hypothetical protein